MVKKEVFTSQNHIRRLLPEMNFAHVSTDLRHTSTNITNLLFHFQTFSNNTEFYMKKYFIGNGRSMVYIHFEVKIKV